MNHCLDCADSIGCRSAVVVCDTLAEPSAKPFLNRFGFRPAGSFSTFEADFIPSQNALCAVRDRLVRSGRIPTGVTIVRLPEAPEHEVAQMIATYLAERSDLANEPLHLERGAEHWRDSIALLFRGHVAAVVLAEFSDGLANTVARIVAPEFRGGWANALLLGAIADIAAERKTERFRFECRDDNRDTLKLARRVNAVPVAIRQRFEKVLRRA